MSWDLCRGGLKHDEIGLVHPRVSFTSPKSLVPNIIKHVSTKLVVSCFFSEAADFYGYTNLESS